MPSSSFAIVNLVLLLALAIVAGLWMDAYTESGSTLKVVLSGEGALVLASFAAKWLLPEGWEKALSAFLRSLLGRVWFTILDLSLWCVFLAVFLSRGAIEVKASEKDAAISVFDAKPKFDAPENRVDRHAPSKDQDFRSTVAAAPWNATAYQVRIAGRPDQPVPLAGLWRKASLAAPADFRRPVILLHGNDQLIRVILGEGADLSLQVSWIDGTPPLTGADKSYRGGAVWIGCRSEVEVPEAARVEAAGVMQRPDEPGLLKPKCLFDEDRCEFRLSDVRDVQVSWKAHAGRHLGSFTIRPSELPAGSSYARRMSIDFH